MSDLAERLLDDIAGYEVGVPQPGRLIDALSAVVKRCAEVVRDSSDPITVGSCDELEAILAGELLRTVARELGVEGAL